VRYDDEYEGFRGVDPDRISLLRVRFAAVAHCHFLFAPVARTQWASRESRALK